MSFRRLLFSSDSCRALVSLINAHSSTPTPVFLASREETQTVVREKLGPKLRPPHTLYLLGKEKLRPWSEFLLWENSDHGLSFGCFWGRRRRGGSQLRSEMEPAALAELLQHRRPLQEPQHIRGELSRGSKSYSLSKGGHKGLSIAGQQMECCNAHKS